jgi:hypothetical protein
MALISMEMKFQIQLLLCKFSRNFLKRALKALRGLITIYSLLSVTAIGLYWNFQVKLWKLLLLVWKWIFNSWHELFVSSRQSFWVEFQNKKLWFTILVVSPPIKLPTQFLFSFLQWNDHKFFSFQCFLLVVAIFVFVLHYIIYYLLAR